MTARKPSNDGDRAPSAELATLYVVRQSGLNVKTLKYYNFDEQFFEEVLLGELNFLTQCTPYLTKFREKAKKVAEMHEDAHLRMIKVLDSTYIPRDKW